jgi:hypothetical protein
VEPIIIADLVDYGSLLPLADILLRAVHLLRGIAINEYMDEYILRVN